MNRPLVSVIIPFLNAEPEFLREAVDSVLAQTYDSWELWLVDDGSLNESSNVARNYAEAFKSQIRCVEHSFHQHRGISAARNLGMQHARGDLIAFLDADDVWLPHKLEEQVAIMRRAPRAAMLYGNTLYWHSWRSDAHGKTRDHAPKLGVEADRVHEPPTLLTAFLRGTAAVPCTCSVMVRRDVANTLRGFVEDFPGAYEDQAFYAKLCLTEPVYVSGETWDKYRQHARSLTAVASNQRAIAERRNFLQWLCLYLARSECADPIVWNALNKEMWLYRKIPFAKFVPGVERITRVAKRIMLRLEDRYMPASWSHWLWTKTGSKE